ncbi:MAG: hypothetical protein E7436_06400 [Ruminococcaceae bacterium]|nr:hypothetical protein [Oscillospiraceae bacterium]MBE6975103.1 hypothetical protein [Oscillospiraceae bacterium]
MKEQHADQGYRKFWATMKEMTWKERWEYFWEYYKVATIVTIFLAVVLGTILYDALKPRPEIIIKGAVVNVALSEQTEKDLSEGLLALFEGTEDQTAELMFSTIVTDTSVTHDASSNYAEITKLVAGITAQELDYLLMDEAAKNYFAQQEVFQDLANLLSREQLAALEGRLVYQTLKDGTEVPTAIDLSGLPLDEGCTTGKGLYIGFPGNTGREDKLGALVEYLLALEGK